MSPTYPLEGAPQRITHGRHCVCSACAQEDWTRPELAACGMHGRDCPPIYAPLGNAGDVQLCSPLRLIALGKFREQRDEWAESREYWKERALAAESEVARLRDGLRRIASIARALLAEDGAA